MIRFGAVVVLAVLAAACTQTRSDAPAQGYTTHGNTTAVGADVAPGAVPGPPPGAASAAAPGAPSVAATPRADTAVGRVAQVGPDPVGWMALTPAGGGAQLRLSGPGAVTLRAVSGAHVWVSGAREANGFRVDAFEVRRVNDQPVDDGIVVVTPAGVAIRMRSGARRDVPNAPPSMREMPGVRIWVSRPVAGVAPSFGVIQRP